MKLSTHKNIWSYLYTGSPSFTVAIHHYTVTDPPDDDDYGHHRWNVYAFLYPDHPLFSLLESPKLFGIPALNDLPLHWGATFHRWHYQINTSTSLLEVTSKQVGSDYNHLHDKIFTHTSPKDNQPDPRVFADALELYNYLLNFPS